VSPSRQQTKAEPVQFDSAGEAAVDSQSRRQSLDSISILPSYVQPDSNLTLRLLWVVPMCCAALALFLEFSCTLCWYMKKKMRHDYLMKVFKEHAHDVIDDVRHRRLSHLGIIHEEEKPEEKAAHLLHNPKRHGTGFLGLLQDAVHQHDVEVEQEAHHVDHPTTNVAPVNQESMAAPLQPLPEDAEVPSTVVGTSIGTISQPVNSNHKPSGLGNSRLKAMARLARKSEGLKSEGLNNGGEPQMNSMQPPVQELTEHIESRSETPAPISSPPYPSHSSTPSHVPPPSQPASQNPTGCQSPATDPSAPIQSWAPLQMEAARQPESDLASQLQSPHGLNDTTFEDLDRMLQIQEQRVEEITTSSQPTNTPRSITMAAVPPSPDRHSSNPVQSIHVSDDCSPQSRRMSEAKVTHWS